MTKCRRLLALLTLSMILTAGPAPFGDGAISFGVAHAQDDDDGGDDDGGDDDDDDDRAPRPRAGSGGTSPSRTPAQPARPAPAPSVAPTPAPPPAPVPAPLPLQAPDEVIALDLSDEDLVRLLEQGFRLIDARAVTGTSVVLRRMQIPGSMTLTEARDAVRALPSGASADFNHYYRSDQAPTADTRIALPDAPVRPCDGAHCPAMAQVGWTPLPSRDPACGGAVTIGMIDTGLNAAHETFRGARFDVLQLTGADTGSDPSRAIHGTAVASLLAGAPEGRSPGLVPHLRLVAVDVFHRAGPDERADALSLVEGLDLLAGAGAQVINLSLAGPPNSVLETMVARVVAQKGIVLVAAAGNGGPRADPVFPAAYDGVIAVTAIDTSGQVYRRAGQGAHVDLAAPGVDVWTAASVKGARPKTGTSFAAPFVTAAAALVLQADPSLAPQDVADRLFQFAEDLGEPGRDPVFGHGQLRMGDLCAKKG